ncbi:competence/damage-inducible protein A [Desulfovibrio sp. OttesenSCG-928-C06]|nr:competence/damage-inducible protein A [Desulfovibrio sp. OttesenSCG-928-C06]
MNAEILCVGTEILLGDIVNTNAAYIARELAELGIGCYYQTVVGDNPERLRKCLDLAVSRADIVITTGGLGPTYDDLTKETVAAHFGRKMELHQESLEHVKSFFQRVGKEMSENNIKQAYMPEGAVVFPNDRGTAPGLAIEGNGKIAIMLPGPPREMTAMFEQQAKPYLMRLSDLTLVSSSIHLFGIGESTLGQELREFMETQTNPTVAPYAKEGEVMLRITARAHTHREAEDLIRPVLADLCERYKQFVYGIDVGNLETALVQALRERSLTLAVAEGASGGLLTQRITSVPGSQDVFNCSMVFGNAEAAPRILGCSGELESASVNVTGCASGGASGGTSVNASGFTSVEAAMALARAAREKSGADIGCAVTALYDLEPEQGGSDTQSTQKRDKAVSLAFTGKVGGREVSGSMVFPLTLGSFMQYERRMVSSKTLHTLLLAIKGELSV